MWLTHINLVPCSPLLGGGDFDAPIFWKQDHGSHYKTKYYNFSLREVKWCEMTVCFLIASYSQTSESIIDIP